MRIIQVSLDSSFLRSVDLVLSGVAVVRTLTSILARAMVKLLVSFARMVLIARPFIPSFFHSLTVQEISAVG